MISTIEPNERTCLFAVGSRVRLVKPDNPKHPRLNQIGVVQSVRWFDPVYGQRKGDAVPKLIEPGIWLLWVHFGPKPWDTHGLFDREIESET